MKDLTVGDRVMLLIQFRAGAWTLHPGARGTITGKPGDWVGGTLGGRGMWHITFDARGVDDPTYWCLRGWIRALDVIEVLAEVERRT
jgi:hypothetical protein